MCQEEGNVTNDNSGSKLRLLLKTSKRGKFAAGNGRCPVANEGACVRKKGTSQMTTQAAN